MEKVNRTERNSYGLPDIVIPAEVLFHPKLTMTEKMLFGVINNLAYNPNGCWATNRYLGKLLSIEPQTVSKMISNLKNQGFLKVCFVSKEDGTNEHGRRIYVNKEVG